VTVNGAEVLRATVAALTPTAVIGFTASTGGLTDVHTVRDVQIVG
jgi:hypothetical protein